MWWRIARCSARCIRVSRSTPRCSQAAGSPCSSVIASFQRAACASLLSGNLSPAFQVVEFLFQVIDAVQAVLDGAADLVQVGEVAQRGGFNEHPRPVQRGLTGTQREPDLGQRVDRVFDVLGAHQLANLSSCLRSVFAMSAISSCSSPSTSRYLAARRWSAWNWANLLATTSLRGARSR